MEQNTLACLEKLKHEQPENNEKYRLIVITEVGVLESFYKLDCETLEEAEEEYTEYTKISKFPIIYHEIVELTEERKQN